MMRSSSESDYENLLKEDEALANNQRFVWMHAKNCEVWSVDPSSELLF